MLDHWWSEPNRAVYAPKETIVRVQFRSVHSVENVPVIAGVTLTTTALTELVDVGGRQNITRARELVRNQEAWVRVEPFAEGRYVENYVHTRTFHVIRIDFDPRRREDVMILFALDQRRLVGDALFIRDPIEITRVRAMFDL
jgi:hypothetical protein